VLPRRANYKAALPPRTIDLINELFAGSNTENNVTAQAFAPLVHDDTGRRVLGRWLTGADDAEVEAATFFWFPLRDAIANASYNGQAEPGGRWPGYGTLFEALGFPADRVSVLPPRAPQGPELAPWRDTLEVEVVAELASSEFDAAFVVVTGGRRELYLVEAKWLVHLGAPGKVGAAGFALNQVQRAIALAAWLRRVDPTTPATYTLCAVEDESGGATGTTVAAFARREVRVGARPTAPHAALLTHLEGLLDAGEVRTAARTWAGLVEAARPHAHLASVVSFLEEHGRDRRFRRKPARLVPGPAVPRSAAGTVRLVELVPSVIAEAVNAQRASFRTRTIARHVAVVQAHEALANRRGFDGAVGSYLALHQTELGIARANVGRDADGVCWVRRTHADGAQP
jgi:hypothetical protein